MFLATPSSDVDSDVDCDVDSEERSSVSSPAALGLAAALVLMTAAMVVPAGVGWDVHIGIGPLFAHWMPRAGPGTAAALAIAVLGIAYAERVSAHLSWGRLLALTWVTGLGWLMALALVDGRP